MTTANPPTQPVSIFNEAGTGLVATGQTTNGGATVTNLSAAVAVHSEYQMSVGGAARRGVLCTAYNAAAHSATFT
jgi:hypothetical protein